MLHLNTKLNSSKSKYFLSLFVNQKYFCCKGTSYFLHFADLVMTLLLLLFLFMSVHGHQNTKYSFQVL